MRAHEFLGTHQHRPTREGARPRRGHEPVARYKSHCDACNHPADECICDQEQLDELTFMGLSPCTKDCSGHRAGYNWFKVKQRDPLSWSPSFNKGAALAKAGK